MPRRRPPQCAVNRLVVPLACRSGAPLGAPFFGDGRAYASKPRSERLAAGVAGQAAFAIDRARLFRAAQREFAGRRRQEATLGSEGEGFSRRVLRSRGDCVAVLGAAGAVEFVDDGGRALPESGAPEAIRGAPWSALWPDTRRPEAEAARDAARLGGVGPFSGVRHRMRRGPLVGRDRLARRR